MALLWGIPFAPNYTNIFMDTIERGILDTVLNNKKAYIMATLYWQHFRYLDS